MSDADEWFETIGAHSARVVTDRVYVTVRGPLSATEIHALFDLASRLREKQPFLFFLFDAREATTIDSDARKAMPKTRALQVDLRVIFGLSFAARTFLNMFIHAQKLLLNRDVHFHVFTNEDEARTFFETESARIRSGQAK